MIGNVPGWIEDLGGWPGVVIILTAVTATVRWAWRVSSNLKETLSQAKDTRARVVYHLGPNGNTPPLHKRIERLEGQHTRD